MSDKEIKPWMREAAKDYMKTLFLVLEPEGIEERLTEIIAQHAPSVPERAAPTFRRGLTGHYADHLSTHINPPEVCPTCLQIERQIKEPAAPYDYRHAKEVAEAGRAAMPEKPEKCPTCGSEKREDDLKCVNQAHTEMGDHWWGEKPDCIPCPDPWHDAVGEAPASKICPDCELSLSGPAGNDCNSGAHTWRRSGKFTQLKKQAGEAGPGPQADERK